MVTSTNDNATYHLTELDGMRLVVPIVGKLIKIFKKLKDEEPDMDVKDLGGDDGGDRQPNEN